MATLKFKVDNKDEAIVVFTTFVPKYVHEIQPTDLDAKEQLIFSGRKEYILKCADHVIYDKIVHMCKEQDTHFPQILPIKSWLEKEGIKYYIPKNAPSV